MSDQESGIYQISGLSTYWIVMLRRGGQGMAQEKEQVWQETEQIPSYFPVYPRCLARELE